MPVPEPPDERPMRGRAYWERRVLLVHDLEQGLSRAVITRQVGIAAEPSIAGSRPESSTQIRKPGTAPELHGRCALDEQQGMQ